MKMPRLPALLALLLGLSAAGACPVKAGYIANGLFRDTTGLTPLCSARDKKLAAQVKTGEYAELYGTTLDAAGAAHVLRAINLFRSQGWVLTKTPNKNGVTSYYLTRGQRQTALTVREGEASVVVVIVGDKEGRFR